MYRLQLVLLIGLNCLADPIEDRSKNTGIENSSNHNIATNFVTKNNVASHHNITYIDKAENLLRTPNLKKFVEEHKKIKKPKKVPKRTIQKIIKKNRARLRKVYFSQKAIRTTTMKVDYDKLYGQEEREKQWRDEQTTTQINQRKKSKKYSPKAAGFHAPFQKMQAGKKDKRFKRGGLSRELYILKDLDEMEFMDKEDGDDVVKAHVKNFW